MPQTRAELNATRRRWRQRNLELERARHRQYYADNRTELQAYQRGYDKEHGTLERVHARRARKLAAEGSHTAADREAVFEFYGWRCTHCAEDLLGLPARDRTLDHIVPLVLQGRNATSNLQPLCRRCNCRKGRNLLAV